MSDVEAAIEALRGGRLAVIPTDTVYGLAADGESEDAARSLYAAKGRDAIRPTALLFASVDVLVERVPGASGSGAGGRRALLPGPLTLVLPNPARRFAWLNAERPEAIGVRVPDISGPGRAVLAALGALVATSANLPGGADPRRVEDVPADDPGRRCGRRRRRRAAGHALDRDRPDRAPSPACSARGPCRRAEVLLRVRNVLTDF